MKFDVYKQSLLVLVISTITIIFIFDLQSYLTIKTLVDINTEINTIKSHSPVSTVLIFFLIYLIGTSLSLPVAGILSIASGTLFGLVWGTIIVSLAGTLGATIAFLLSRFLFRDIIQNRYAEKLIHINNGISENGKIYLLSLRLMPVVPYFIINAVMGLTPMPVISFSLITMLGMVPITILLVNGGTQLATINSMQDILTPKLIISFTLIACIPLLTHYTAFRIKRKKQSKQ